MQMGKSITLRQIFFLLYLSKTTAAPYFLTNLVIPEAGMAAWQILVLDDFFILLGTYMIIKLSELYPGENCITYFRKLLGKWGGIVAVLLLAGYFFFQVILLSRGIADIARLGLLLTTPQWIIVVLLLWPAAYAVSYGITPITRFIDSILLFGFPLITLSFLSTLPNINLDFFTGFWLWKPSMFISLNFFGTFNYICCFMILYVLYPHVQATPRQIMGSSALAVAVASTFMYAPTIYLPMLIFGPEGVLAYRAPLYAAIQIAPLNLYLIENVGLIFYSIWTIYSIVGAGLYLFCAMTLLYSLIPIRKGLWLIPLGLIPPLSYAATFVSLFQFIPFIRYAGVYTFGIGILFPALLLLIHAFRQRKERPDEAAGNM